MKRCFSLCFLMMFASVLVMAENGVTSKEIVIGVSNAQEGPSKSLGLQYSLGANAYFKSLNDAGGINGRKIKIIQYNDGYEPAQCILNTNKLIKEDKAFVLFGYVGTPTSMAVLPIVQKEKIPFFFPFSGAPGLRDVSKASYVFNLRSSYEKETEMMVDYLVKKGKKKIAIFYQDDLYGKAGMDGTLKALNKREMKLVSEGSYVRNTIEISNALASINKGAPEAIIMIGTYKPCSEFIKSAKIMGMNNVDFLNISFVGSTKLLTKLGKEGEGVIITEVVPFPWNKNIKAIAEYQDAMRKQNAEFEPEFISLEGYLGAKILAEMIEKTGKDLTRKKLIQTIEAVSNLDIGIGQDITFSKTDHEGFEKVYMTEIKDGKFIEK